MDKQTQYGRTTEVLIARLAGIVGGANVLTGDERENYSRDEAPGSDRAIPDLVVKPGNSQEVAGVLRLANDERIPVIVRGAGTGLVGGAVAFYGGIVLSVERMNRILEVDRLNFVATVEPAVTLEELYQAVEECGLYYPLYPGEKSAAIGGNVATNAGGMRAVKYGVTRNFVLGLEAVLPTGEVIETGGKFVKCSTGYDLTQLIIGSEGTLAVITRVLLRLTTRPGQTEILFIPFHSLHEAIESVPDILARGILPVGIEFMQKDAIQMVEQFTGKEIPLHDHEAFLLILVEGADDDEIHRISSDIGEVCLSHGAVDVYIPGSERAKRNLMEAREKFYPAAVHLGILDIADVVVPRSRIADFMARAREIGEDYGIPLVACGHAGDGNVHLCLMDDGLEIHREKATELLTQIFKTGVSMGGTVSGEHGLGSIKKEYLALAYDEAEIGLMKRIKQAFDPNNIMNPGKVFDIDLPVHHERP
jgi:glycolate oxidase